MAVVWVKTPTFQGNPARQLRSVPCCFRVRVAVVGAHAGSGHADRDVAGSRIRIRICEGCLLTEPRTRVVCASIVSMNVTPVASVASAAFISSLCTQCSFCCRRRRVGIRLSVTIITDKRGPLRGGDTRYEWFRAGAGRGAFAALTFIAVDAGDELSRLVRDYRSRPPLAVAIGTSGIIKIENESRHAMITFRSRLVIFSEIRDFIGFSWVPFGLIVELSVHFVLALRGANMKWPHRVYCKEQAGLENPSRISRLFLRRAEMAVGWDRHSSATWLDKRQVFVFQRRAMAWLFLKLRPLRENSLERNTEIERQVRLHIVMRQAASSRRKSLWRHNDLRRCRASWN